MKLGWDHKRNLNRRLIAWKSDDDPTPGDLSLGVVLNQYPDIYMMEGEKKYFRFGPWNGLRFSGIPNMEPNDPFIGYNFVYNKEEVYYIWHVKDSSQISKVVLNQTSYERRRYIWSKDTESWMLYSRKPADYSDHYGLCGVNGYLSSTNICECLKGFKPKFPKKWKSMDWSQGCVRNHPLNCTNDRFVSVANLKLPETTYTLVDQSIGLEQCRGKCLNNCSCMAYTNTDISGAGSGCVMWFGDLTDIKLLPVNGQVLYIRMPASELGEYFINFTTFWKFLSLVFEYGIQLLLFCLDEDDNNTEDEHRRNSRKMVVIGVSIALGMIVLVIYFFYRFRRNIFGKTIFPFFNI